MDHPESAPPWSSPFRTRCRHRERRPVSVCDYVVQATCGCWPSGAAVRRLRRGQQSKPLRLPNVPVAAPVEEPGPDRSTAGMMQSVRKAIPIPEPITSASTDRANTVQETVQADPVQRGCDPSKSAHPGPFGASRPLSNPRVGGSSPSWRARPYAPETLSGAFFWTYVTRRQSGIRTEPHLSADFPRQHATKLQRGIRQE